MNMAKNKNHKKEKVEKKHAHTPDTLEGQNLGHNVKKEGYADPNTKR